MGVGGGGVRPFGRRPFLEARVEYITDKANWRWRGGLGEWGMGVHSVSLGFTLVSLHLTWFHSVSLGLTWFTWFHLVSLGLTWSHLVSLGPSNQPTNTRLSKGKRDQGPRQKGKGNGAETPLEPGIPPYIQSARGDERNETISRLDSLPQPPIYQGVGGGGGGTFMWGFI